MDRRYFKEIFMLEARTYEGQGKERIDFDALTRIFSMVGFEPNEKQIQEFQSMFDQKGGSLSFNEFLEVFSLKGNPQF